MKKLKRLFILTMLLLFGVTNIHALDGNVILKKVKDKEYSKDGYSEMIMYIYDDKDNDNDYRTVQAVGFSRGSDDSYTEFVYPNSINGMKMLVLENDNIWVFFPSTGRTRKIAEHTKNSSIKGVGGDFNYEDMSMDYTKKYNAKIKSQNKKQWTLILKPKVSNVVYEKIILYVNKKDYSVSQVDMYDDSEHVKSLFLYDYKTIKGVHVPSSMVMMNYENDTKTEIISQNIKVNIGVDEKYFSPSYLE